MCKLTLALSKGRILVETLPLLNSVGILINTNLFKSRKLIISTNYFNLRILIVRASDVPFYVKCGAADFGIVGKDILIENNYNNIYQVLDLNIAKCRMVWAVKYDFDYKYYLYKKNNLCIATKYVNIAKNFFKLKKINIDIVKLYGSIELAPLIGLSNSIVDLVGTGCTLNKNNLIEIENIMNISSKLIINKNSFKLKYKYIYYIYNAFKKKISKKIN